MSLLEKFYTIFAVIFAIALLVVLLMNPELRTLHILLPVSFIGVAVNIGLLFVVLKDIFLRSFANPAAKYIWLALVLFFWPSILYYLPKYGFRKRS